MTETSAVHSAPSNLRKGALPRPEGLPGEDPFPVHAGGLAGSLGDQIVRVPPDQVLRPGPAEEPDRGRIHLNDPPPRIGEEDPDIGGVEDNPERLLRASEPGLHSLPLGRPGDHSTARPTVRKEVCREENRAGRPVPADEVAVLALDPALPDIAGIRRPDRAHIKRRDLIIGVPEHRRAPPVHLLDLPGLGREEEGPCTGRLEDPPVPALARIQAD